MSSLSTTPSDDGYHDHETPNPNGKIFLYLLLGITVCAILVIIIFLSYRRRKKFKGKSSKLKMRLKSTKEFYASDSKYASLEAMKYPLKKLTYIEELGKGVFGIVFKASAPGLLDPHETTTVAVKVLRSSDRHNKTKLENFAQEANLISTYKHPNLIQLLGVCTEENCPRHASGAICCLLFEYMDGGDLCALLRRHGPNRELFKANSNTRDICLTDKKKLIWCSQIACGMQYLSERNFIHRDLATRNCLLSSKDWTVKIADFGLSRCTYESDYYTAGSAEAVPIRWMSPEAILYGRYSWQSDVWAFGVTLWEIYTYALQPYYSLSNEEVVHQVCEGNTLPKPPDAPDWMFNLMKLCWQTSPDDRPNFITIYSVLEAIYLNNGLMPNTYPQSYVQQTIAETQLHSNGNDRNEMRLPGWNMADWALPPPRQFSSVHSDQVSSISADRVTQNSNLPNIAMQSAGGIVQWSRHNNSDSCLPDSPSSIPSLSVN